MARQEYELKNGKEVWNILEKIMKNGRDRSEVFTDFLELILNTYLSCTYNFMNNDYNAFVDKLSNNKFDGPYEDRYSRGRRANNGRG